MSSVHRRSGAERAKPETSSFPTVGAAASSESAIQGEVLGSPHTNSFLALRRSVDEAMLGLCKGLCAQVSGLLTFSLWKAFRTLITDISMAAVAPLSQVNWAQEYF